MFLRVVAAGLLSAAPPRPAGAMPPTPRTFARGGATAAAGFCWGAYGEGDPPDVEGVDVGKEVGGVTEWDTGGVPGPNWDCWKPAGDCVEDVDLALVGGRWGLLEAARVLTTPLSLLTLEGPLS